MKSVIWRKVISTACVSSITSFYFAPKVHYPSLAEEEYAVPQHKQSPIEIEDNGEDEDDAEWMVEKEKCSFCKQFLESPCKIPFRRWSKCVDKAKENNLEFVGACFKYTGALIECTTNNEAYFRRMDGDDDDDDVVDENEIDAQSSTDEEEEVKSESDTSNDPVDSELSGIPVVVQDLAEGCTTKP
jgi:GCK domain